MALSLNAAHSIATANAHHPSNPLHFPSRVTCHTGRFSRPPFRIASRITLFMTKRALRAATLAARRELTPQQVSAHSLAIQRRFLELPEFQRSAVLALYSPIHQEVETAVIANQALSAGKTLLYPAVHGSDLKFHRVAALHELVPGNYGIPEPTGDACNPADADLIVIPGVAFDTYGRRIGYGKGFYDRTLHRMEGSGRLVGFCYDFQLLEEIVGEPHDVTMDLIVTESRVVRVKK
jgi:5-formyltetrahydrofolate cyclo-ligase